MSETLRYVVPLTVEEVIAIDEANDALDEAANRGCETAIRTQQVLDRLIGRISATVPQETPDA